MFSTLFQLMGMMFLLISFGAILRKRGIVTDSGKKCITDLILYAVLPGNIIKAFSSDLGENFLSKFLIVLIVELRPERHHILGRRDLDIEALSAEQMYRLSKLNKQLA